MSASHLVEAALSQIRPMATYKGVAVSGEVSSDLPLARADSQKMTRVLVNLLDNALRFTPEGGTITLSARRHDNFMLLEVRDSGEGIAPERLERMFHKFGHVTSDDPTYRVSSGLGLTFCKLIVQEHGGTIEVQSVIGQGSLFSVSLPLHQASKA